MTGCPCPHSANYHGSLAQFPTRMCLVAGCDCNGTNEEVITAYVQRNTAKRRVVHELTDLIRTTMANDRLPMRTDDLAHEVAMAIVAKYEIEAL